MVKSYRHISKYEEEILRLKVSDKQTDFTKRIKSSKKLKIAA